MFSSSKTEVVNSKHPSNIICRNLYQKGLCNYKKRIGKNCIYIHPELCIFYMKGNCKNGDECDYLHPNIQVDQSKKYVKKQPGDVLKTKANIDIEIKKFKFKFMYSLNTGMEKFYVWYKNYKNQLR